MPACRQPAAPGTTILPGVPPPKPPRPDAAPPDRIPPDRIPLAAGPPDAARLDAADRRAADLEVFDSLTSVDLSERERRLAETPEATAPGEGRLLAIHFHPEWVPLELIERRLARSFPDASDRLVIPTQHNQIMAMGPWAGVEADVYAPEYSEKIQLLIHLPAAKLPQATAFRSMMERTFRYRALQLLEILEALTSPDADLAAEIGRSGLDGDSLALAGDFAARLQRLIDGIDVRVSPRSAMLKNRLLTDFMQERAGDLRPAELSGAMSVAGLVKSMVKRRFDPSRFHTAREVIEEARGLGAGVVIPHPPQFWPALLDDLDVDGWEVWNPSTPRHALFLVDCLGRAKARRRPLLAFMGDDTHMSSKIRPDVVDDKTGQHREIGFQPPWRDPRVAEALRALGQSRERTMDEYRGRIA